MAGLVRGTSPVSSFRVKLGSLAPRGSPHGVACIRQHAAIHPDGVLEAGDWKEGVGRTELCYKAGSEQIPHPINKLKN